MCAVPLNQTLQRPHRRELQEREDLSLRAEHALLRIDEFDLVSSHVEPPDLRFAGHVALANLDLRYTDTQTRRNA